MTIENGINTTLLPPWFTTINMGAIRKFYLNEVNVDTQLDKRILGFAQFNTKLQSFISKFIMNLNQLQPALLIENERVRSRKRRGSFKEDFI